MPMKRVCATALEAVEDVGDGASILVQSFGPPQAWPTDLLLALRERQVRDLTIICNSPAGGPTSLQILGELHQIRKLICTYAILPITPTPIADQIRAGEIELELVPQGTLVERVRAGGAGLAAFYTPTGVGTAIADGQGGAHLQRQALHPRAGHPRRLHVPAGASGRRASATSPTGAAAAISAPPSRRRRPPRSPR